MEEKVEQKSEIRTIQVLEMDATVKNDAAIVTFTINFYLNFFI